MTDAELDRLQVLADAATAGPWGTIPPGGPNGAFWGICNRLGMIVAMRLTTSKADAEFIAASRDAVPALIAEVRRLQEELLTAIERTQGSVHDYYYDKIRDMTIEIEQLHDQIGRDAISYAQCDSDRRNFAARCAWMREELMDRGVTQKELDEHE